MTSRSLLPLVCALVLLGTLAVPTRADAVSLRDLIELTRAGLSDEVLVALVEADDTTFNLDAPKILELRAAGVSERVIIAMLRKRPAPAADARLTEAPASLEPPASPEPQVNVTIVQPPAPDAYERRVLLVPWWSTGPRAPAHATPQTPTLQRGFGRFMNDGWVDRSAPSQRR